MKNLQWIQFLLTGGMRNLMRSPRRTMVSLTAIGLAVASLIIFESFVQGVSKSFKNNVVTSRFGHYQLFNEQSYKATAVDGYERLISNIPDLKSRLKDEVGPVTFVSRQLNFFGLVNYGENSSGARGIGVDAKEEQDFLTLAQVHEGKHLGDSDKMGIFIGYEFAAKIGARVGDTVSVVVTTADGLMNAYDFNLTGTFKSGVAEMDKSMFFIHIDTARELMNVQGSQNILIGFSAEDETQYEAKLDAFLAKNHPELTAVHWRDLATYFDNTMGWLGSIFGVFRIIILIIAGLSIINVFTITLLERVGEFGTLRAIGTRRGEVTGMIMVEGVMQAVIGTGIGVVLGIIIIVFALHGGVTMPPPLLMTVPFFVAFTVPWKGVLVSAVICAFIASAAGIFPAWKISKINIVEALGRNV